MKKMIKRMFDIAFALLTLPVVVPVVLISLFVVKLASPKDSPVFKQVRIGYRNQPFTIYKIRTMTNDVNEQGELLSDELRLKLWGKIIRATNIDELTQVYNILKLEMSWIGPRPLLAHEMLVMSQEEQLLRQKMLPGISGWEAVNEGVHKTRRQMAELDLEYVVNWSLWMDIRIFFKTVWIVLLKLRPDDSIRAPKEIDISLSQPAETASPEDNREEARI